MDQTNQTVHMIMPSKDKIYNGRKGIGFENPSYFCKAKDLRPTLYDDRVINLGYTLMFLTHSDEALEIEKFKGIINLYFDKIDSPFQQTSSLKPYVSNVILEKIIIDLENEVVSLLDKEKVNLKIIESLKSKDVEKGVELSKKVVSKTENKSENDCQVIEKVCDSEENPNMKKGSSNTVKANLSSFNQSNLNKNMKRYSCKNLMACNNSDTRSAFDCNNARNALCNARMNTSVDVNDLFVFDDVSIRKYHVSKMPFRKKPSDSLNVPSRSKMNKSLPRIMRKWFPKLQPLAEPVVKWIPKVKRQIDKISKTPNSSGLIFKWVPKHMTGNRALLMSFVEQFLGTVRFGNKDFAVIAGYGDVGLEVAFRKSTCSVRIEDGVDLLTDDRSSNLYTIALKEVASNSSACLLAKASSTQSWLWHQRLSHLNFTTIINLVKNNLVQGLPKMKFEKDHLCSTCEQGKIHQKHHKSKSAFDLNKLLYLLHMDWCGLMRVESINGKRYVLVVVDDYSRYTWVFFLHSKDEASEVIISFIKKTQVNLQIQVQCVRTDNGTKFKNKTLAKFFDEVGITQQFFAARIPQQNGIVERRNRMLVEAARTMLTFANLPLFLWAEAIITACFTQNQLTDPSSNTQSVSNNMVPNVDEASTSHNVFNECLEDVYFDASTSFHDPSNVHTFYQPYPHKTKWTKDHPLHKIIGDSKSSVRTRGKLANSCLFSCLLSSIEPANMAEDLKDADWVSAILEELDQFKRLKEVYAGQPPGFVSKQYLDHVYALDKSLYGLKQAPRAWYDVLSQFLIESSFQKVPTPMVEQAKLKLDLVGKPVDRTDYQSMIGSLMYVTSSRPDIMFATCMIARYQANHNERHVSAVKRIFCYLKGTINLGLWYQKDAGFDLTAYSNADHVGCHLDRKIHLAVFNF
nr:hypothetical protein [Tanacetum cinerariifolium]